MHKIILVHMVLVFTFNLVKSQSENHIFKLIQSKNYSAKFSVKEFNCSKVDSLSIPVSFNGLVNRHENQVYSKQDFIIGIQEDTTCFLLDSRSLIMDVGPMSIMHTAVAIPFYDPFAIIELVRKNYAYFQKHYDGESLVFDYLLKPEECALYYANFAFETIKGKAILMVKIIYQRRNEIIEDEIVYEFIPRIGKEHIKRIADYLDFRNGRYFSKEQYAKYFFFNSPPIKDK